MTIWQLAFATVQKNRVQYLGMGRDAEIFEVGTDDDKITVRLSVMGLPRVVSCSCKQHSVKDVFCIGYCSAVLAVLYYKVNQHGKT